MAKYTRSEIMERFNNHGTMKKRAQRRLAQEEMERHFKRLNAAFVKVPPERQQFIIVDLKKQIKELKAALKVLKPYDSAGIACDHIISRVVRQKRDIEIELALYKGKVRYENK